MHLRVPQRVTTQLVFFLAAAAIIRGDITLPVPPPPQADVQQVRVQRGGSVTIPLRAHYGGSGTVSFSIASKPRRGILSDLRLLGDNRAEITYRNDGAESTASDAFTYVAKSSNGVSSPAEVSILVEEPPAKMRVPDRIDFGEVMAGESESRSLHIANEGGGVLEGRVTASAPWMVAAATYRVGAGETESIAIAFRPNEGRSFVGQITILPSDGARIVVPLSGVAKSPVALEPEELDITVPSAGQERRSGKITLTNRTARTLSLRLEASAKVKPIDQLVLGPGAKKEIEIEIVADGSRPVHEEASLVGSGFRLALPINAEAAKLVEVSTPAPVIATSPPVVSTRTVAATAATPVLRPPAPTPEVSRKRFVQVRGRHLGSSKWELHWPRPANPVANYRIEERFLSLNDASELQTNWKALTPVEIANSGDSVIAKLGGLDPKNIHLVRIAALGSDGAVLWEAPLVTLAPPRESPGGRSNWLLILGMALGLLVFLRWWLSRRRA